MIELLVRLHRFVLRRFGPSDLGREYGDQIEALLRDLLEDARRGGPWRLARVFLRELHQVFGPVRRLSAPYPHRRGSRTSGVRRFAEDALTDLRLAALSIGRRPSLSGGVVLTLAVGMGLTAAVYSTARVSILAPIPVPDADRLVVVTGTTSTEGRPGRSGMSAPELAALAKGTEQLEELALFSLAGNATLSEGGTAVRLRVSFVSPSYFQVLGTPPALGRVFGEYEKTREQAATVILSHRAWVRRFGGDSTVIGRRVDLAGAPYEVVGVMPKDHWGLGRSQGVEAWLPLDRSPESLGASVLTSLTQGMFWGVGVRAGGATLESIDEELSALHSAFAEVFPIPTPRGVGTMELREYLYGGIQEPLLAVTVGALLVLVICGVNVSFLVGLRARERREELGVRSALGGSRARLLQAVVGESMILALMGAAGALLLARTTIRLFMERFGDTLLHFQEVEVGAWLSVAMVIGALAHTSLTAILATAWSPRASLTNRGSGAARNRRGRAGWVIAAETGLSVVVLVAVSLSARSLRALQAADLGYDPKGLDAVRVSLRGSSHAGHEGANRFARELDHRLSSKPGVKVGIMGPDMMGRSVNHVTVAPEGVDPSRPENRSRVQWISLTPGTFDALGIRLLEGRDVAPSDEADSDPVVVLSEDAAAHLWPGETAVGKRVNLDGRHRPGALVVGVVREARHVSRYAGPYVIGDIYFPLQQRSAQTLSILYRGGSTPLTPGEVAEAIRGVDAGVAPYEATRMTELLAREENGLRLVLGLSVLYATISVFLVSCGMVSLIASSVHERRGELAVRAALGAGRSTLVRATVRGTLIAMAGGLVGGVAVSVVAVRPLTGLLYRTSPTDPVTYAAVACCVVALGVLSTWIPARMIAGIEPGEAMRSA